MPEITAPIRKDFVDTFGIRDAEDDVIGKIESLKSIFNLSTEEVFVHWETFNVNELKDNVDLSVILLDKFHTYLQNHLATLANKATPSIKKSRDVMASGIKRRPLKPLNSSSPMSDSNFQTPSLKVRKRGDAPFKTPNSKLDSSPSQFQTANNTFERSSPGSGAPRYESNTVLETLHGDFEDVVNDFDSETGSKIQISANFDASKYKFRTMAMKLLESADMLDEQIDNFTQVYQEAHKEENVNFANPCLSHQTDVHCCGRIVPDSPIYDKMLSNDLNSTSLFLETSRLSGIGQRVPLDLTQLKEYSFFPGQIVCVKGRNPTGSQFIVQQVLSLPDLGAPVTSKPELQEFKNLTKSTGLKSVIAAGPFSNSTTVNYDRFSSFIERLNDQVKPDIVVLLGPFIDLTNKAVQEGDIELPGDKPVVDLDDVFRNTITPVLKKLNPKIQVILIPSIKDATIKHCSYPQDSFDRRSLGLPKNVKVFPNPSGFSINEMLFGCSNLDVYKDLKDVVKIDAAADKTKIFSNRFERITNQIFEQRRYYPSFPGSIARKQTTPKDLEAMVHQTDGIMAEEVSETKIGGSSLEVSYQGLAELGDSLPDVLIMPSELKYFAKVVKNVVVINPGSFIRSNRDPTKEDGTYVVMDTKLIDFDGEKNVEQVQGSELFYHNVFERSKVTIYKS